MPQINWINAFNHAIAESLLCQWLPAVTPDYHLWWDTNISRKRTEIWKILCLLGRITKNRCEQGKLENEKWTSKRNSSPSSSNNDLKALMNIKETRNRQIIPQRLILFDGAIASRCHLGLKWNSSWKEKKIKEKSYNFSPSALLPLRILQHISIHNNIYLLHNCWRKNEDYKKYVINSA